MREVSLDARTVTSDGATGSLEHLIVDPSTWTLTHIVTDLSVGGGRDVLVPVEYVSATSRRRVNLALTSHELLGLPERAPSVSTVAFRRGAEVLSFEEDHVGHLQSVLVGNVDARVWHVVVRLDRAPRVVTLPIGAVQDTDNDRLRLCLAGARLARLAGIAEHQRARPACEMPAVYQLVSVVFDPPDAADRALGIVRQATGTRTVGRVELAVLRKDASGRFTVDAQRDLSTGSGVVGNAVAGALLGLVARPVGSVSAVPDTYVHDLGAALASDSSALVLLIQERFESLLLEKLAPLGGEVLRLDLSDEMLDRLIS